jgi:small subunit ribosomal protein S9
MEVINAIGRRKSAVARVYLTEGTGKITINKKDIENIFPSAILRYVVKQPLQLLEAAEKYDIKANLDGGGFTGQSQALRLAIARALVKINAEDKKASRTQASSHVTAVLLSVRSQVSQRLAVASSSASVNLLLAISA